MYGIKKSTAQQPVIVTYSPTQTWPNIGYFTGADGLQYQDCHNLAKEAADYLKRTKNISSVGDLLGYPLSSLAGAYDDTGKGVLCDMSFTGYPKTRIAFVPDAADGFKYKAVWDSTVADAPDWVQLLKQYAATLV